MFNDVGSDAVLMHIFFFLLGIVISIQKGLIPALRTKQVSVDNSGLGAGSGKILRLLENSYV